MAELVMFTYPWDIAEQGTTSFLDAMVELGVNRLSVATCYHSAELIAPNRLKNVAIQAEPNVAHLPLQSKIFSGLSIPEGRLAKQNPELFYDLAKGALERNIGLTAWTIAFHNSDLAQKNPETAIENCFGDKFSHGLCATNPMVQTYAKEMIEALCQTGYFDTVMVESLSYLLHEHGHPHELWGVRMDPHTRVLLSLCFCSFCMEKGKGLQLDGMALRARVASELKRTWNGQLSIERAEDDGKELAARLVYDADFAGWVRMRCDVVNSLAQIMQIRSIVLALSLNLAPPFGVGLLH